MLPPSHTLEVKFATRKVRGYVFAAERSVEHLDRQCLGIKIHLEQEKTGCLGYEIKPL